MNRSFRTGATGTPMKIGILNCIVVLLALQFNAQASEPRGIATKDGSSQSTGSVACFLENTRLVGDGGSAEVVGEAICLGVAVDDRHDQQV